MTVVVYSRSALTGAEDKCKILLCPLKMQLSTFQNRIMTASSQLKQMISDSCDPEKEKKRERPN